MHCRLMPESSFSCWGFSVIQKLSLCKDPNVPPCKGGNAWWADPSFACIFGVVQAVQLSPGLALGMLHSFPQVHVNAARERFMLCRLCWVTLLFATQQLIPRVVTSAVDTIWCPGGLHEGCCEQMLLLTPFDPKKGTFEGEEWVTHSALCPAAASPLVCC